DGLRISSPISQRKGVLQGDSLGSTLFVTCISSLANALKRAAPTIQVLFYADDLLLFLPSRDDLQSGLDALLARSNINYLQIVNRFDYLGVSLQPTLTFTNFVEKKKNEAAAVIDSLHNSHRLSTSTAMKTYRLEVQPIVTYGLKPIARRLKIAHMIDLDKIK
ncbi:unnamed protein product, partial [Darwinula stevensoni]